MTDIVERLRENADLDAAEHVPTDVVQMQYDAADEIERMREERDAMANQGIELLNERNALKQSAGRLAAENVELQHERDALAAVVSQVVECIGRLPHEPNGLVIDDLCRIVATDSDDILAARDARVRSEALREAQKACIDYAENAERDSDGTIYGHVHANTARALYNEIGRMADAIEKGGE